MDFSIWLQPCLMDKTSTVGQKWPDYELDLHFWTLKNCTKGQSNRSILSKVIMYTERQTDIPTDRHFCETLIFGFRRSQNVKIC